MSTPIVMSLNPDWFLVGLTAIYVVATIAICWANWASASAAKSQTVELIRQYADSNRARIAIRFDKKCPTDRQIVLKNIGRQDAENVRLSVDNEFMDSLHEAWPENLLQVGTKSTIHIAAGQEFWFFVGFASLIDRLKHKAAYLTVEYTAGNVRYEEKATIDFSQYDFISEIETTRSFTSNGRHYIV